MNKHRFQLVLPIELWERLRAFAKKRRRTVTAECVIAIEKHLEQDAKEGAK
jgi:predicted DNA-binding protein